MTNTQQAISDGLPEHLRPIYARSLRAMKNATANEALVICGALFAVDELNSGRPNPQRGGMRHRDWSERMLIGRTTATYPRRPEPVNVNTLNEWEGPYAPYNIGGVTGPIRYD